MDEKLRILMQRENLTASRLAEILEIQPAAISHILKGRNKPSFELVCRIINRFPQVNPYWLLGDAEEIYNNEAKATTTTNGTLFDMTNSTSASGVKSNISESAPNVPISTLGRNDIEKVIIVYRGQTFEELRPKR
jgi:transcriptional regulator with XRE-family HTH domain